MLAKIKKLFGLKPKGKTVTIEAKVIRADGTVEDLGVISKGTAEFLPSTDK